MSIKSWNDTQGKHLEEVKHIFFEASWRKDFKDSTEKQQFFDNWVGFYLEKHPDQFFLLTYFALLETNMPTRNETKTTRYI